MHHVSYLAPWCSGARWALNADKSRRLGLLARLDPVVAVPLGEPVLVTNSRRHDLAVDHGVLHAAACNTYQLAFIPQILKELFLIEHRAIIVLEQPPRSEPALGQGKSTPAPDLARGGFPSWLLMNGASARQGDAARFGPNRPGRLFTLPELPSRPLDPNLARAAVAERITCN